MATTSQPAGIPAGYSAVTPYLIIDGAAAAIAWYQSVFDGKLVMRLDAPSDRVGHAEIDIDGSRIMLADQNPDMGAHAPASFGGSPITLHLYVTDVDAVVAKAVANGATLTREVQNQFYGDRSGGLKDPFGHTWHVATHVEDVSIDEVKRRMDALHKNA